MASYSRWLKRTFVNRPTVAFWSFHCSHLKENMVTLDVRIWFNAPEQHSMDCFSLTPSICFKLFHLKRFAWDLFQSLTNTWIYTTASESFRFSPPVYLPVPNWTWVHCPHFSTQLQCSWTVSTVHQPSLQFIRSIIFLQYPKSLFNVQNYCDNNLNLHHPCWIPQRPYRLLRRDQFAWFCI